MNGTPRLIRTVPLLLLLAGASGAEVGLHNRLGESFLGSEAVVSFLQFMNPFGADSASTHIHNFLSEKKQERQLKKRSEDLKDFQLYQVLSKKKQEDVSQLEDTTLVQQDSSTQLVFQSAYSTSSLALEKLKTHS